jgi:glutamine synthetase
MSHSRFSAIENILTRSEFELPQVADANKKISSYFGINVFNDDKMREYLTEKSYKNVKLAIESGAKISRKDADIVAEAMKRWAMDKGATHYTHWFQPLTGRTAEKHDSFFTLKPDGSVLERFSGSALAQQEPDGSSFPGGGLRSTFEARGYTAWDPSSPAFIIEMSDGKTLCIPTIFVTYSGEALDYKLPLLKSQSFLEQAAIPVCQIFDKDVDKVFVTLGWEQEYFLVDEALYHARPDLVMTGRTLLGKHSPKGQQLDDHYFGTIPQRAYAFMRDLEIECHKLAIPITTRHNEVGPGQYEFAPMFEDVNVAVDHNQLLMDLMDRVAQRHRLRVLLHEKPFAGVNGSGKHNNWSMATNKGKNLLSPGETPGKNLQFLTFFVNTIQAVYQHANLLRASVASASNDHRLGANEAPPAIISVFIGEKLSRVLNDIAEVGETDATDVKKVLDLLSKIPSLEKDNTDRNRTSPFAFTGNKFEIRMVGSTMNCASPMTVMNTIVGKQLEDFNNAVQEIVKKEKVKINTAALMVIKDYIKEFQPILFEGDGYSDEWKEEAARRGLANTPNTPEALDAYVSQKSKDLFQHSGVFSVKELEAHYDVMCENYILKVQIEARVMGELTRNHILPAAIKYQNILLENVLNLKELGMPEEDYASQVDDIQHISRYIREINKEVNEMIDARRVANKIEHAPDRAKAYCDNVKPYMETIRRNADKLEYIVDDADWPMVKYRELMFIK